MSGKLTNDDNKHHQTVKSNVNEGSKDPDVITVLLVPHKKGLFLKHSEYEIQSKKHKCVVFRRYNDFVHFHSLLLTRFPYRMIPRLPPKQLMLDSLLEERRRGLQRWLRLVSRHPVLSPPPMIETFLTDNSQDHQQHLRDIFSKELDEFSKFSEDIELPMEDQGRLAASREMMRSMLHAVSKLKKVVDQQATRMSNQSKDMDEIGLILKHLGSSNVFDQNPFTEMSGGISEVSRLSEKYATLHQSAICERFNLLLDVLTAHSDLCERVENGIVSDHQRALYKMLNLNKQKIQGVIRGTGAESVAALHQKEVAHSGVVGTLGRRSAFSLYCVLQETSLAQTYLQVLPSILLSFSHEQNQSNSQISDVWNKIVTTEASKLN